MNTNLQQAFITYVIGCGYASYGFKVEYEPAVWASLVLLLVSLCFTFKYVREIYRGN